MAKYAVRRLGQPACTVAQYNNIVKREALIKAGDKEGLAKFDAALKVQQEKTKTEKTKTEDNK